MADRLKDIVKDGIAEELVNHQSRHIFEDDLGDVAESVLVTLRRAGWVTMQLPEPAPRSELYDVHFDVLSDDDFMHGPRTPRVCIDTQNGEIYQVCTPTAHITATEARSLASALLAAAERIDPFLLPKPD